MHIPARIDKKDRAKWRFRHYNLSFSYWTRSRILRYSLDVVARLNSDWNLCFCYEMRVLHLYGHHPFRSKRELRRLDCGARQRWAARTFNGRRFQIWKKLELCLHIFRTGKFSCSHYCEFFILMFVTLFLRSGLLRGWPRSWNYKVGNSLMICFIFKKD